MTDQIFSDFKKVVSKKSKTRKNQRKLQLNELQLGNEENETIDCNKVLRQLDECRTDLKYSSFFSSFSNTFAKACDESSTDTISSVICFGLGNFATSITARYQLSLILLLIEKFNIQFSLFYDPCFYEAEKNILKILNCSTSEENLEGKYKIPLEKSIVFLPHCPTQLTNNLLWKNWISSLDRVILISNSISYLITHQIASKLKQNGGYITRIKDAVKEFPIPNDFHHSNAFNDSSIHIFLKDVLESYPLEFWEDCPEPVYDLSDLEIITAAPQND